MSVEKRKDDLLKLPYPYFFRFSIFHFYNLNPFRHRPIYSCISWCTHPISDAHHGLDFLTQDITSDLSVRG